MEGQFTENGFYEEARSLEGEAPILMKLFPRLNSGKFSPLPLQFYRVLADFSHVHHSSFTIGVYS